MRPILPLLLAALLMSHPALGQSDEPPVHRMVVNADLGTVPISRHIYGHFIEHLGRGVYGGFWDRDDAGRWHLREDVIEALRRIRIPNLRWPGGCFADTYHWKDGVGPQNERRPIVNIFWGGDVEDNSFGTHEFMELVDRLGAEPYIAGNVGSGTVQEMADWVEYLTYDGPSHWANLRRAHGRDAPWKVTYWGVGNENWGCGGNMTPQYYADLYRRYATYLPDFGGNRLYKIANGASGGGQWMYDWTDVVMRELGDRLQALSFHYYAVVGSWQEKGSATDFTEDGWIGAMQQALRMEDVMERHLAIMDRYDPDRSVDLIVDEWGIWHDPEPGTNPAHHYQQSTLRDGLVTAVMLDILNRHADRVKMANVAQTVNVIHALILTGDDGLILTPSYHVFDLYQVHHDATLLPAVLDRGTYTHGDVSVPALSSTASRDADGRIHLSLTNLDPHRARTVVCDLRGATPRAVSGRVLTAPAMQSHNTFDAPEAVRPQPFDGATLDGTTLTVVLPPRSVVALEVR